MKRRRVGLFVWGMVWAFPAAAQTMETSPGMGAVPGIWWLAPLCALAALGFAYHFYRDMMGRPEGTETMRDIAERVREGAYAYLKQQYKVVAMFFGVLLVLLGFVAFGLKYQSGWVPFAFLTGGFFSGLSGFLGMKTATNASSRTANAARESLNQALRIAFRSGSVMGLTVVGLALLDICLWFLVLFGWVRNMSLEEITVTMLSFGIGASTQALFARVGGGIFTKGADVGADLVGKVEAGIPEDDPRNPAVIADNVGDNVGDVAGMGADLYESYAGSILATMALGVAAAAGMGMDGQLRLLTAPLVLAGLGILASIVGIYLVRTGEEANQKQLLSALYRGINLSSLLIVVGAFFLVKHLLPEHFGVFWSIVAGLGAGLVIGWSTNFFTSDEYPPARAIAHAAKTGPATVIIEGMAVGLMSTGIPIVAVVVGILVAYGAAGGFNPNLGPAFGLYGVGIAAVGMLSTLGITLATDAYGPIADNAGGNAEMSHLPPEVRQRTDALDALGNTTAATGKGFAIGSAALTALALLAAYIEEIRAGMIRFVQAHGASIDSALYGLRAGTGTGREMAEMLVNGQWIPVAKAQLVDFMAFYGITLMNPKVLAGMFIGSMAAFFFCALTMRAVGRSAGRMVEEVRRQFRERPGIMEGTERPDYATCVQISTQAAQREMVFPSLLAIIIPLAAGIVLGAAAVVGVLMGALATGFVLAIMMANAGGAWDNAKKFIEKGNLGGKGSDVHKASVVGDTVGDPFKDTSGPSLNILIKLMSMISVVFAGVTVVYGPLLSSLLGLGGK